MTDNRTTELREKIEELRSMSLAFPPNIRRKVNMALSGIEQAIAVTLGNGRLTAEQVREAVMSADRWEKPMGNTGLTNAHLIIRDDGWQAIADELNAVLGGGECHLDETEIYPSEGGTVHVLECSECGHTCEHVNGSYPRCPHCGRRCVHRG